MNKIFYLYLIYILPKTSAFPSAERRWALKLSFQFGTIKGRKRHDFATFLAFGTLAFFNLVFFLSCSNVHFVLSGKKRGGLISDFNRVSPKSVIVFQQQRYVVFELLLNAPSYRFL
jgi:hypothetical protein